MINIMKKKINFNKNQIEKVLKIQKIFRKRLRFLYLKNNLHSKCQNISILLSKLMLHSQFLLDNNKINTDFFSNIILNMERIVKENNLLNKELEENKLNHIIKNFFLYYKNFIDIDEKVFSIACSIGNSNLLSLLNIYTDFDLYLEQKTCDIFKIHFDLYNLIYIPTNFNIYVKSLDGEYKCKKYRQFNKLKNHNLKLNFEFDSDDCEKLLVLDKSNHNLPYFFKVTSINQTNIKLCIPFNNNLKFLIKGYFIKDSLNIFKNHSIIKLKYNNLENFNPNGIVDLNFFQSYLCQIPLENIIIDDEEFIKEKIFESYNELKKLKCKTVSNLVKDFLISDFKKKSETLTILLLNKEDSDSNYLAYLLFDMISSESTNKNSSLLLLRNLHWSIQKRLKISMEDINIKQNKLLNNINDEDISYEKRIFLMKVDDYVKQKALEKYKEISSKSNDSSTKAQQYLDGILKIPFGIYKIEKIIEDSNLFKFKIKSFLQNLFILKCKDSYINDLIDKINLSEKNKMVSNPFINNLVKDYRFYYFNSKFRFNIDLFNKRLKLVSYSKLKQIIKSIKKLNNNSLTNKNIKLTDNLQKVEVSKLAIQIYTYVEENYMDILISNNEEKMIDFKNMIECFGFEDMTCYSDIKLENFKSTFNNFLEIKKEWYEFNKLQTNYLNQVLIHLDNAIYGHNDSKNKIQQIIAQWINGDISGYCFGFEGPPGTGKTSIAKKGLTKCLIDKDGTARPFGFIAVGGSSNGSTLEGHSYTYVGSTWGKIVDILMENKCMNPIIFIDELDKISNTEHGKELIGILTHLTDSSQNNEFNDKYFSGVKIDLSKVLFIFSYNNPELIDPILLDRIQRVKFNPLKKPEKIFIVQNYLLPEICSIVGFNPEEIILEKETIIYIIENYTFESGVRKLKERIFEIVREINLRYLLKEKINNKSIEFPYIINNDDIDNDIFNRKNKIIYKKIADKPMIGMVNGLYATQTGLGGITIIESYRILSNSILDLELTGSQGDVMKESMKVARTVAWNIITSESKRKIKNDIKTNGNFGLHIHCPEGATPKDGPSAGLAITTSIVSILIGAPVNNKIAMTGEINLNGEALQIGGLESKLYGAKNAGVEIVLIPKQNEKDLHMIKSDKNNYDLINNLQIIMVQDIWDVLNIILLEKIRFNKYTESNNQHFEYSIYDNKITLDSYSSYYKNDQVETYHWKQISGPNQSKIENINSPETLITNLDIGLYEFNIDIITKSKKKYTDLINIRVNDFPNCIINKTNSVINQDYIYLDGRDSQYMKSLLKEIKWNIIDQPSNSYINFNSSDLLTKIENLIDGEYKFSLSIIYNNNNMSHDYYTFMVKTEPYVKASIIN